MITYTKDEIISSTTLGRNIGNILDRLRNKKLKKVAVIRNNEFEAVILPLDEYERIYELMEYMEISQIIKQREKSSKKNSISFDEVLREYGIDKEDL